LVPAEGEVPTSLLPPGFLTPRIRPLSSRALVAETNAIASSLYRSLHPSGMPPGLPISTPSTSRRVGIPEANTPPQNRPLLATPRPGWQGLAMAHGVDCSYIETRLQDTERRMMDALELVNRRNHAAMRAEIEVLRNERLTYEQEEARVAMLETHARRLKWQRQAADDFAVEHIMPM
nr:hypothetical protein [Tanacetum cinerariifolium]